MSTGINRESFLKWFLDYTNSFYSEDKNVNRNIRVKEEHTLRVVKNIGDLSSEIKTNENIDTLSFLIALFHDLGRFEQFKVYGTFNDKKSEDHAALSVKILKEKKVLKSLSERYISLISNAILYHNKKDLYKVENSDEDLILLSEMIRDADKLDILGILSKAFKNPEDPGNRSLQLELPESSNFSDYALSQFLNNETIDNKKIKNVPDFKLLLISWIFDLNFKYTIEMIIRKKYLVDLIESLPQNKNSEKIKTHTLNFIESVC